MERIGWHDVIALPDGRTATVVGDAMGHGPEAAAAMSQLRTAAHVLADLELPPGQLLHRLDRTIAAITAAPFATCICVVTGPRTTHGKQPDPARQAGPATCHPCRREGPATSSLTSMARCSLTCGMTRSFRERSSLRGRR